MRLIFGFVFFGLVFYAIWFYYPDAFQTLVSWAAKTFNFLHDLVLSLFDKFNKTSSAPVTHT